MTPAEEMRSAVAVLRRSPDDPWNAALISMLEAAAKRWERLHLAWLEELQKPEYAELAARNPPMPVRPEGTDEVLVLARIVNEDDPQEKPPLVVPARVYLSTTCQGEGCGHTFNWHTPGNVCRSTGCTCKSFYRPEAV